MMIEMPDDIDAAIARYDEAREQLVKAVALCEAEQQAGRTGLACYHQAKALREQVDAFGAALAKRIDEEMDRL